MHKDQHERWQNPSPSEAPNLPSTINFQEKLLYKALQRVFQCLLVDQWTGVRVFSNPTYTIMSISFMMEDQTLATLFKKNKRCWHHILPSLSKSKENHGRYHQTCCSLSSLQFSFSVCLLQQKSTDIVFEKFCNINKHKSTAWIQVWKGKEKGEHHISVYLPPK